MQHCTNLPRPYSRIHTVQGTKGIFQGYPNRLYIEGRGKPHQWLEYAAILKEFDHPLWRAIEAQSAGAGHGGMDYIEDYRLIQCLREGRPTDMNVYDAAALSAVVDLSVQSTAQAQPRDRFSGFHSRPLANEPETSDRRTADGDVRQLTAHIIVNAATATHRKPSRPSHRLSPPRVEAHQNADPGAGRRWNDRHIERHVEIPGAERDTAGDGDGRPRW